VIKKKVRGDSGVWCERYNLFRNCTGIFSKDRGHLRNREEKKNELGVTEER